MHASASTTVTAPPPAATADAPVALFISDLHLQQDAPHTAAAFFAFLRVQAPLAQQLYILGDLFEYWAGDDDLDASFNASVVAALRGAADAGVALYWMAGNRDFLIGAAFAAASRVTLLPDPSIVSIAGRRLVLTHGDAACTDDIDYQQLRRQLRDPTWQRGFLAQPLATRLAQIAALREGSRNAQKTKNAAIMDVNADAIAGLFQDTATDCMIHGHTHRPASHVVVLDDAIQRARHVLSDWDFEHGNTRGDALAIDADGKISRLQMGTA
jgi:UDP-2,3-diacylglucosamine hydrolase